MRFLFALISLSFCPGCSEVSKLVNPDDYRARADSTVWASKNDLISAARRCGVMDFEPFPAGDAWAAYTDRKADKDGSKEDCIYADVKSQGMVATR